MANWRTVSLIGTVEAEERHRLIALVANGGWSGPLSYTPLEPSLGGLYDWAGDEIITQGGNVPCVGTIDDIADQLTRVVATVPSLRLKVHCGGEYEDPECIATITVADGLVTVGPPELEAVWGVHLAEAHRRLALCLMLSGRRKARS